jgi:hypothetical protein
MAVGRAGATPTTLLAVARGADVYFEEGQVGFVNSAYVDWKTFLSRLNIAGPKPG